jgi:two-component system, NtrC family, response regulator HydG
MPDSAVLLISDDPTIIEPIQDTIDSISQLRLVAISEVDDALPYLQSNEAALLLFHVTRPSDLERVPELQQFLSSTKHSQSLIVLADEIRPRETLRLLKLGVADCMSRPLDLGRLSYLIDTLTVRQRLSASLPAREHLKQLSREEPFFYLESAAMSGMMQQVQRVAPQETFLLFEGETGTGKTRLARLVHELSPRHKQPFLVVNCGALAENLIESELFGHVRGAFTGADRDRIGKFAAAGKGTLLLDEIDSLTPMLQAKFLRAVEERIYEPVGSNKPMKMEARLIVASNRSLAQEVDEGRFRSDLYFRLNVVSFYMPPLRERREIIPHLADHFVAALSTRNRRPIHAVSEEAQEALLSYDWPGNIRELRNVIERAVALCPKPRIEISDLPDVVQSSLESHSRQIRLDTGEEVDRLSLRHAKGEAEAARIMKALEKHSNNRLRAALELGISRMTLYKKMHRYGLMEAI